MKTKRLNIAMRPTKELAEYMYKTVKELGQYGEMLFELDGVNYFPHATIYSPEFPAGSESKIVELLEDFCARQPALKSTFTKLDVEDGYIVANFIVNNDITNFHKSVVSMLNPVRNGALRERYLDATYMNSLPENKRENILRYGYPGVMAEYMPHFTLTRYKNVSIADEICANYKWNFSDVEIYTIGVFEMGENGTCVKLLKEFKLLN